MIALNDKTLVIVSIIAGIVALAVIVGFIGQGNIRHVQIFFQEKIEQTVAFREVDGEVKLVGLKGIGGDDNPTLVIRTGFAYVLLLLMKEPHFIDFTSKVLRYKQIFLNQASRISLQSIQRKKAPTTIMINDNF